ncbi:MAG: UpxY family transcription antiterminator [Terriglobales bacterium]
MQTDVAARQQAVDQKIHSLAVAEKFSVSWFAAYTNSHHEKRVASLFTERQIESFLPLYSTRHRWRNRCTMNLELPLFRNYVFVRIDPRERVRVLEVPGVLWLVGFGRSLAPLPDFEIETLRSGLGRRKIEPHPYLVIGERVRIKVGPMMGMEGVLIRKKNNFRVVLALDVIMQCVAVEVDAEDLEAAVRYAGCVVQASAPPSKVLPTAVLPSNLLDQPNRQRQPSRPL